MGIGMKTKRFFHEPGKVAARGWPFLALCLALLALPSGCAVNPATGAPNLVLMSAEREKKIGLEEHEKIMQGVILYENEALNAYVSEIGNRLAKVGDRPELEYQFFIIDSPEINAFALPGGYIYVNRGLLNFLNAEAELAGVIGHEIAHVTARHSVQQHARGTLAQVAAQLGGFVTSVATGSGYVGSQISQVASIWAQAGLSGYGREHELEADRLGAEYLRDAGYDPMAMIDALSVLKHHEDFQRLTSNRGGGYHGLFASHPRNDQRLQQTIASVRNLDPQAIKPADNSRFREATEGMIFGPSRRAKTSETRNRYYQPLLGYTMVFPENWFVDETTTTATATAPSPAQGSLTVEAQRLRSNQSPRDFLVAHLQGAPLEKSEALEQFRLLGHTGIAVNAQTGRKERVAAIYLGSRAYLFRASLPSAPNAPSAPSEPSAPGDASFEEADSLVLEAIRSFRPIERGEESLAQELRIRYVIADENFDYAVAAQNSRISDHAEETLRLLNGDYPIGSPEPGEWVKLVE